ncbi:MAG: hypothetical protein K2N05_11180 [Muribaculaceae bacterium]|nr:hypothetical protein [Muribaculaceae bacterium]
MDHKIEERSDNYDLKPAPCMISESAGEQQQARWYAVKTWRPMLVSELLEERGIETYLPLDISLKEDGSVKRKPLIPKLLFIRSGHDEARKIEDEARKHESPLPSLWIYRYRSGADIQPIGEAEFRLFRLLTAQDSMRCEIYQKEEFKVGDRLRVTAGPFAGYEGYARRIRKNKHIVVEIEGLCAIALPFIHPDLLVKVT